MLVNRLKCFPPKKPALSLRTRFHVQSSNPVKILDRFLYHLENLYSSPQDQPSIDLDTFNEAFLPALLAEQCCSLMSDVMKHEVRQVIQEWKANKYHKLDRFTALFYEKLQDVIVPCRVP